MWQKIKIFYYKDSYGSNYYHKKLENAINTFLKNNNDIMIH